jgi:hypothetical protein
LTNGKKWDGDIKKYGTIISFSFDPNREESGPIDEYITNEASKTDGNPDYVKAIKLILNSSYIFKKDSNGLIMEFTMDEKETYSSKLVNSSSLLKVAEAGINLGVIDIDDSDLDLVIIDKDVANKLDRFAEKIKKSIILNPNKITKSTETNLEDVRKQKVLEILKQIIKNVIELNEINNGESDDFETILDMIYEKGYDDEVVYEIGVGTQTIKKWLGALPLKQLNTIITQYNISEKNMVKDFEY